MTEGLMRLMMTIDDDNELSDDEEAVFTLEPSEANAPFESTAYQKSTSCLSHMLI